MTNLSLHPCFNTRSTFHCLSYDVFSGQGIKPLSKPQGFSFDQLCLRSKDVMPRRSRILICRGRTLIWRGRGSQIPMVLRDQSGCERSVWVQKNRTLDPGTGIFTDQFGWFLSGSFWGGIYHMTWSVYETMQCPKKGSTTAPSFRYGDVFDNETCRWSRVGSSRTEPEKARLDL